MTSHRRSRVTLVALAYAASIIAAAGTASADDDACIAANEASIPLRHQGQLHAALKQLVVCADPSCPEAVRSYCAKGVDTLGAAIPTIVFAAKDGAGNDLYAVKVTMDGAPLVDTLSGVPISLDPGEHLFRFETAGEVAVEKKLVIREGEKHRRETVVIGRPPAPVEPPPPPRSSWSTQKTLAIGAGGAGVVGLGLGVVFGLYAQSTYDREKRDCPSRGCSGRAQAAADYDAAKANALGSTVAFITGAAFLAGGAALWFTVPKSKDGTARSVRFAPMLLGSLPGLVVGGVL